MSVTADATKAVVVAASIGTVAPELNAVATVTAAPVARLVTPAFFIVVHDIKRTETVNKPITCGPVRQASLLQQLQPALQPRLRTSFASISFSICPCYLLTFPVRN